MYAFPGSAQTNPGDTMIDSVWSNSAELPAFPQLEGDLDTDMLIIGGGLAGILCAYKLAQEGVRYALIEADRVCCGISRNTTAKITSQHGCIYGKLLRSFGWETARAYWEANEAALSAYRVLCAQIDCDFETKDSYVYSTGLSAELEEEMAALDSLDIPAQYVDRISLPISTSGAIRFSEQAQFHPLKFANGILRGLNIYEKTAAREFVGNGVVTDHGRIRASKIIVATHFPMLNKHGGYFLKLYQQRSYVLALENAGHIEGMYRDAAENGLSFRSYGDTLLIGGGGHRTGRKGGGWAEPEAFARACWPDSREVCRWAAQDCMTLDGIPYIGRYSKATPELYVATGFNKWGMTSSMVAAEILSDLVQGRKNEYASVFSPQRSALRPQLLCNAGEALVNLLTPTKPRCPHMGCALKWNPQEHSWDCPCHGSRFARDGRLLDNPATDDLK